MASSIGYHRKTIVQSRDGRRKVKKTRCLFTLLLHNIIFGTALENLALIVHLAVFVLALAITLNGRTNGTQCTLGTILNAVTKVFQLTFGFLLLASGVLLSPASTKVLVAGRVAHGFLD